MTDTSKQTTPLRVAYYIRVSTEDQADRYGPAVQKNSLDAIVASRGVLEDGVTPAMQLAGEDYIYTDNGISGTLPLEERPAFARLQEDLTNAPEGEKPFDVVAVYKIDRFARKLKILLDVIELFNTQGVKFISVHESIDTATPFGRAILGIVGVLAELELETIKERTHAGRKVAIDRGVYMGTVPPYGYTKDTEKRLIVLPQEAEVVQLIFSKFVNEKESVNGICRFLHDNEVESPGVSAVTHSKRKGAVQKKSDMFFWRPLMVKKVLSNEIYIGNYFYNKTHKGKPLPKEEWQLSSYHHEPIIDRFLFEKAQKLLDSRRKFHVPRKVDRHVYLLSGLLKCGCCYDPKRDAKDGPQTWHGESKEIGKGSGKYSYYYRCRRKITDKSSIRCKSLPLPADQIEKYVVARLNELLQDPRAVFDYQNDLKSAVMEREKLRADYNRLRKRRNGIPERVENLKMQQEHGVIDIKELEKQLGKVEEAKVTYDKDIQDLEVRMSAVKLGEDYLKTFALFKKKYEKAMADVNQDRAELQKIIRLIVDRIEVHTRPVTEKDVIAGRRAEGQEIPHKIALFLRLPKEYMQLWEAEVVGSVEKFGGGKAGEGFGDDDSIWWGRWGSNPRHMA
jgi:site-specific DNA recombinase